VAVEKRRWDELFQIISLDNKVLIFDASKAWSLDARLWSDDIRKMALANGFD
jgi:hypothetical protein